MSARPWMPLYIGDFIADTMHLSATETGMYIRLLMHCWQHGSIPREERKLALIAHCDTRLWHQYRGTVLQFFDVVDASTMSNKRVSSERLRAEKISSKRKGAALQMHSRCRANAVQMHTQSQPQSHGGGGERAAFDASPKASSPISQEAFTLSATIAKLCGHDEAFVPPAWAGAPLTVQGWLNKGWTAEQIEAACRDIMGGLSEEPPSRIRYFEKGIARFVARLAKPLPTATSTGGRRERHLTPHQQRIADRDAAIARLRQRARDPEPGGADDGGSEAAREQC